MTANPRTIERSQRLVTVQRILALLGQRFGAELLAVGLYGSTARGSDGPYSDIEMYAVIEGEDLDTSFEWSAGEWKAEVDIYSPDNIRAEAALLEGDWPITHGSFVYLQALQDPQGFFPELAQAALQHADEEWEAVIREEIIGEIYELIGKVRNAEARGQFSSLASYAVHLTRHAACLVGLANRHLYTSSYTLLEDALALAQPPAGFDPLCRRVIAGQLSDPQELIQLSNTFWQGVLDWAEQRGLALDDDSDTLLLKGSL